MKIGLVLTLFAGLALSAPVSSVHAGHEGSGSAPFDFEYTFDPGQPTIINDDDVGPLFDLSISLLLRPPDAIEFMELEIAGLSHESPGDINIILFSPSTNGGGRVEIMDDRGGQFSISDVNLIFSDGAAELPPDGQIVSGRFAPESPLSRFLVDGTNFGTDPWRVIIIDDSLGGAGSFDSITLRGHFVPEPATLSLLMLGALAMFHRRRR